MATILVDSQSVVILDVRVPSVPVVTLTNHFGAVNSIQWAPHSSCHICSAAEDSQALIWDLSALPMPIEVCLAPEMLTTCLCSLMWIWWPADLPPASAGSDMIRWSRVLLSHTLDAARSY